MRFRSANNCFAADNHIVGGKTVETRTETDELVCSRARVSNHHRMAPTAKPNALAPPRAHARARGTRRRARVDRREDVNASRPPVGHRAGPNARSAARGSTRCPWLDQCPAPGRRWSEGSNRSPLGRSYGRSPAGSRATVPYPTSIGQTSYEPGQLALSPRHAPRRPRNHRRHRRKPSDSHEVGSVSLAAGSKRPCCVRLNLAKIATCNAPRSAR